LSNPMTEGSIRLRGNFAEAQVGEQKSQKSEKVTTKRICIAQHPYYKGEIGPAKKNCFFQKGATSEGETVLQRKV